MPERSNGYQLPSWPMTLIDRLLWNSTMADLDERLKAREALEASFENLQAQGIQASLNYIQVNVAPQLANLKTSIDLAQAQIDQIIVGGKAPDTLKFGGQLPAYYATAQALSQGLAEKVPSTRKVNGKDLTGDIALEKADVGLGNANNTADKDKPVSDAQREAIDAVAQAAATLAATKASKRNRHTNPAFQVNQDRVPATDPIDFPAATQYAFDGLAVGATGGGILRCTQALKASPGGSPYRARLVVQTVDASLAANDYYIFEMPIEGRDIADLQFGTAEAKSFVWRAVVCLPAGTYGLSFRNGAINRSFVKMFTIAAEDSNKDKLISVTVPGDTAGTWIKDDAGIGIGVRLTFGFGSTFLTANEGVWQNGNFLGTAAQTNAVATVGNTFELAEIGLYAGSQSPEWQMPEFADDFRKCRRYFRVLAANVYSTGHGSYGGAVANFDVTEMRGTPNLQYFSKNNFGGFPSGTQGQYDSGNSQKRVSVFPTAQAPSDSGAVMIAIANSRM